MKYLKIKMLEICMKNKIIYEFLQKYKQKRWCNIIPSLLEIAILNLYISFKRYIFSESDLSLIIENLRLKYNPVLSPENNIKAKKIIQNKKKVTQDINIPKFRKNLKLNLRDYLSERKDLYRSFTKRAKNINELNIYSTIENKKIHYYIKSSEVTPIKGFINYNETDFRQNDNRYKNIFKLDKYNKRHNKNNFKNININNPNKVIDYNTIDHSDFMNNEYQNIFNIYKNYNQNTNYSFSLERNNNRYIKVNKNNGNKKLNENIYNEKRHLMKQKDNNYNSIDNDKEINGKNNKIKKILKNKLINENNKKFKIKNNSKLLNFNQKQIINKQNENKNNLNLNITNYYKKKIKQKNISKTTNNSLLNNSPHKKYSEINSLIKLQKYKNSYIITNNSQINRSINNFRDIKNLQIVNIKKNFKDINLRNVLNKERKTENSNKNTIEDITNNTISNVDDINISYSFYNNNNIFNKGISTQNKNNKKKIINYNSFNNYKNVKKAIFLNDPSLFNKNVGIKKVILDKKINHINANSKDKNFK